MFSGSRTKAESFQIVDKISFNKHPMLEHFKYLNSITKDDNIAKFTIPSPSLFHFVQSHNKNNVYGSDEELMEDIISVYQSAIKEFYDAGCRYLQFDDTAWGTLCSKRHRSYFRSRGIDPEALSKNYVRLINESVKEKPEDMIITLHVCRGNLHSIGFASVDMNLLQKNYFLMLRWMDSFLNTIVKDAEILSR